MSNEKIEFIISFLIERESISQLSSKSLAGCAVDKKVNRIIQNIKYFTYIKNWKHFKSVHIRFIILVELDNFWILWKIIFSFAIK